MKHTAWRLSTHHAVRQRTLTGTCAGTIPVFVRKMSSIIGMLSTLVVLPMPTIWSDGDVVSRSSLVHPGSLGELFPAAPSMHILDGADPCILADFDKRFHIPFRDTDHS